MATTCTESTGPLVQAKSSPSRQFSASRCGHRSVFSESELTCIKGRERQACCGRPHRFGRAMATEPWELCVSSQHLRHPTTPCLTALAEVYRNAYANSGVRSPDHALVNALRSLGIRGASMPGPCSALDDHRQTIECGEADHCFAPHGVNSGSICVWRLPRFRAKLMIFDLPSESFP